jgi:hypothetical protein
VPGDVEVVDAVRAGEHAGHDRGDLGRRVRPRVPGQPNPIGHRIMQAHILGQPHHRHQPGARHQIRIIKRHARHRRVIA